MINEISEKSIFMQWLYYEEIRPTYTCTNYYLRNRPVVLNHITLSRKCQRALGMGGVKKTYNEIAGFQNNHKR